MYSALHEHPELDDEPVLVERLDAKPQAQPARSETVAPQIRSRLHVICALYAHTPSVERRMALLDHLETLTLEAAAALAQDLLEKGWRPPAPQARATA